MNRPLIQKALGALVVLLGIAMLLPLVAACYYKDPGMQAFLYSCSIAFAVGGVLYWPARQAVGPLKSRGAFLLVTVAWFTAAIVGGLPFYLSGTYPTLIDATFEAASGFTTTGATVLSELETLPRSILLWRSFTQFLGGMGIIVLSLAVLPLLGVGGMDLFKAESPGPTTNKITARVSETARALWVVYVFFFVLEVLILRLLGMSLFDAVNHGFTTMATGGFSTKNASIAAYNSAAIDWTIIIFMFIAGASFLLHYRLLVKGEISVFKDPEFRFYSIIVLAASLIITASLWGEKYDGFLDALRYSTFQVVALLTTTGYVTADYLQWGYFTQALLLMLMVVGGCSGSTGGGIKCIRGMLLLKQGYRELKLMIHPKAVLPLKIGPNPVPSQVSSAVFGFFFLFCTVAALSTLVLCAAGSDLITSVSATISALSNVGPALGDVGPLFNYGPLSQLSKVMLTFCMIVGRLEVMTVLVLFTSEFWNS